MAIKDDKTFKHISTVVFTASLAIFLFCYNVQFSYTNQSHSKRSIASTDALRELPPSSNCAQILRTLLHPDLQIRFIRESQYSHLEFMKSEIDRFLRLAKKSITELYTYSSRYTQRHYAPLGKFGFSYDSVTNKTTFVTFADASLIKSISLEVFDGANPDVAQKILTKKMIRADDQTVQITLDGNFEGKWIRYNVTSLSVEGHPVLSQYNEPIPTNFYTYDLTGLKSSTYKTTQIYFPPRSVDRPRSPEINGQRTIWEINIADIRPSDVPESKWGTVDALLESEEMRKRMQAFDGIEILPPRDANLVTTISSNPVNEPFKKDVAYLNHWGYMGKGFNFSERFGGTEGMIKLVDEMHKRGKLIYIDHVFQHTANDMKEWQWLMKKPYMDFDRTGCGNTVDLTIGTVPEQVMTQILLRDLNIIGFDGSRQDLFGAIPKETAIKMRDLTEANGKRISGEPYGYPFDQSFWNRHYETISGARLWDDEARRSLRDIALHGGDYKELLFRITGGSIFSWKKNAKDATLIIETHDGQTVGHALNKNLKKIALLNTIQLSAQGDLLIGPGQPFSLVHHELNDTPINMHNLEGWQKNFNKYFSEVLKVRKRFSHFFEEEWIDPSTQDFSYIHGENNNVIGMHFHKQQPGIKAEDRGELIILFNLSNSNTQFNIPSGNWQTLVNSSDLKANSKSSIYDIANSGRYGVSAHSTVWLFRPID